MNDDQPGSDRRRIEALENVVRSLVAEVQRLQAEVRGGAAAPAAEAAKTPSWTVPTTPAGTPAPPAAPSAAPMPLPRPSSPRPPAPSRDLEQLIGRYGTVVVATLAILLGLGAFLQWAIARGLLGPEVRVGLGVLAAAVLAALGFRVRGQGSVKFGNALFAIALAVVQVDAWGAGPELGIIPPRLALAFAAVASGALAALALRETDEFLFALGLGGAMIAPFVTSTGDPDVVLLLVYGGVVLAAAIVAMREPGWRFAPRLMSLAALVYVGAGSEQVPSSAVQSHLFLPSAIVLGLAVVAVALGARGVRRTLVRDLLALLVFALVLAGSRESAAGWVVVAYAFMGVLTVHALRRRSAATDDGEEDTAFEVVTLPVALLLAALLTHEWWNDRNGGIVAAVWIATAGVFLAIDAERQRARHLAVALTALVLGALALLYEREVATVIAAAIVAGGSAYAISRMRDRALVLPLAVSHFLSVGLAWSLLEERRPWMYTPFGDADSLAALAAVAAVVVMSRLVPQALFPARHLEGSWSDYPLAHSVRALGPVAAFLWIRTELAQAFTADVATFVLITYYAACGIGSILFGRTRNAAAYRQVGLVLSLFAAFKAVSEASGLDNVGLRVGSYLVVGIFLLAVGYLYRARPTAPQTDDNASGAPL